MDSPSHHQRARAQAQESIIEELERARELESAREVHLPWGKVIYRLWRRPLQAGMLRGGLMSGGVSCQFQTHITWDILT